MPEPTSPADLKTQIAAYWDVRSGDLEQSQGIRNPRQKRAWLDFLGRSVGAPPKKILDAGTGTGFLALLLAELGHDCKGVDLSEKMVREARRWALERRLQASFEAGDVERLAEADETYDVVVNRNTLWTLPSPQRALAEWKRVLRPGGLLFIIDGNWFEDGWSYRLRQFLGFLLLGVSTLSNPWAKVRAERRNYDTDFQKNLPLMRPGSREKFPELVRAAGFADVRCVGMAEVDRAELHGQGLTARLIRPHRFFAVTATRSRSAGGEASP